MRKSIKKNSKNSKKLLKSPTTTTNNSTLKKCEDFCKNDYVVEMAKEYKKFPDAAKIKIGDLFKNHIKKQKKVIKM